MSRNSEQLRILAFEPFDAGSHRAVRESVTRHSQHEWKWITRPGRFWKWRMRAAAIEMIELARQQGVIEDDGVGGGGESPAHDIVFITSLMSAADLRAMLPSPLRVAPMVLYMHENQATYPERQTAEQSADRDIHFPLTNLTSVFAADMVIWNSAWNRDSFLDGIERILGFGPDLKLPSNLRERVLAKSCVIWPPVERSSPPEQILHNAGGDRAVGHVSEEGDDEEIKTTRQNVPAKNDKKDAIEPVRIVWPHRWEHDKGPDELLTIARRHSKPLNLRWTILGERYSKIPPELTMFQNEFADRIDHVGYVSDRARYQQHLARCDWVLSTAQHEFFGIAVVEAMLAGCLPWLPQRLSYPELLPLSAHELHPARPPDDPEAIRAAIREHLRAAVAPAAVSRLDQAIESLALSREPKPG